MLPIPPRPNVLGGQPAYPPPGKGTPRRDRMPTLTKWYLDLVTPEGTALVAYAATLRWGGVRVDFASSLLSEPGRPPREDAAWTRVALPQADAGAVTLDQPALGLQGRWVRSAPRVGATLLEDDAGAVRWDCHLPGATATVVLGSRRFEGLGYVECLTLDRPPQDLPLRTLRWGRYVSQSHTLVWIDWRGGEPRRWVWLDGERQPLAVVDDAGVRGLAGDGRLELSGGRGLVDRRALQVVSRHLPALDTLPLGPLRSLREVKRLDHGALTLAGARRDEGWAVHEVVRW